MNDKSYEEEIRQRDKRQKQLDAIVTIATDRIVKAIADRKPRLHSNFFYGASAIHPKHLVTWYLFETDADLAAAKESGLTTTIEQRTREELSDAGYPANGVTKMMVSFTTHEEIERETGGDYWSYFK